MSRVKYFQSFFFLGVILLHVLSQNVNGVPLQRSIRNSTKSKSQPVNGKPLQRSFGNITKSSATRTIQNSTYRNGRLLGKFSFLAGVGLPDPVIQHHLDERVDNFYDLRAPPTPGHYNLLPTARWGPYVAAIYEPVPVFSFYDNPLGYIATYLNPFNWFASTSSTSKPEHSTTQTILADKNQDNVVVLVDESDNEIPNENRNMMADKMEMKMEKENEINEKLQNIYDVTSESLMTMKEVVTEYNDAESTMDLIAEETTIKSIENRKANKNLIEEIRRAQTMASDRKSTKRTKSTTKSTDPTTVTTLNTDTDTPETITMDDSTSINGTTQMITTMTSDNVTSNATNQTPIPEKLSTWYPSYFNGYYYNGYPQNVSHVEFTTPAAFATTESNKIPNMNDISNQFVQQYPTSYYDSFEPPSPASFDYVNRFDQLPAETNDYYNKYKEFLSSNDFDANGFKPSFPFLF